MLLGTSPPTLHKSIAEKSPWQGEGSDSEIKTYFAHLAQHQIGLWVSQDRRNGHRVTKLHSQIPAPIFFLSKNLFSQKISKRFYWTLWFLKGWMCEGCYIYTVNVSYPSQTPVLSVFFWCLRVVGRRFCPLVEPKVWSLDWLLGAGQAGKIHPTDFIFFIKLCDIPKSTTDMKDDILVWVINREFFFYISTHMARVTPQPWVPPVQVVRNQMEMLTTKTYLAWWILQPHAVDEKNAVQTSKLKKLRVTSFEQWKESWLLGS